MARLCPKSSSFEFERAHNPRYHKLPGGIHTGIICPLKSVKRAALLVGPTNFQSAIRLIAVVGKNFVRSKPGPESFPLALGGREVCAVHINAITRHCTGIHQRVSTRRSRRQPTMPWSRHKPSGSSCTCMNAKDAALLKLRKFSLRIASAFPTQCKTRGCIECRVGFPGLGGV